MFRKPLIKFLYWALNKLEATPIHQVEEFHKSFHCPIGEVPHIPDGPHTNVLLTAHHNLMSIRGYLRHYAKEDNRCQRVALKVEESAEMTKALADRDVIALLDAGADIQYINNGTMITYGLNKVFNEAFSRVHESNLSKLDDQGNPVFDETGKVKKSALYRPVDLTDLVTNKC